MTEYIEQGCPLCNEPATYRLNDGGKYKVFHCRICRVFAMSDTAEKRIANHSEKWKSDLSKISQGLSEEQLLRIYAGKPGSNEPICYDIELRTNWRT